MKTYKFFAILLLLTSVFMVDALAFGGCPNPPVGAPLDGGLLAILGAAGVAYFVARKKKKSGE